MTRYLEGGLLKSLAVDWLTGTLEASITTPASEAPYVLRFSGLDRLVVPRRGEWRGERGIAGIHGPFRLEHDRQHLRVEMLSGGVIEIDYVAHEFDPALELPQAGASPAPSDEPAHPAVPDLHDAPLRDMRLSWPNATAELHVGPLISTSASDFGAAHVALKFTGVRRFIYPRQLPWDYFNPDVLSVLGPVRVENGAWHLRLAMQDGDVIEVDYGSMTASRLSPEDDSSALPR